MSGYQFPGRKSKKMVQVAMAQLQGRQEVPLELASAFLEFLFQLFFHLEFVNWQFSFSENLGHSKNFPFRNHSQPNGSTGRPGR